MIEKITQYLIKCDSCGKRSGIHHDENAIVSRCVTDGWDGHPSGPSSLLLFRCPTCVKNRKYPKGWDGKEASGGN